MTALEFTRFLVDYKGGILPRYPLRAHPPGVASPEDDAGSWLRVQPQSMSKLDSSGPSRTSARAKGLSGLSSQRPKIGCVGAKRPPHSGKKPQSVMLRANGLGTRCSSHRPQHLTPHSGLIHGSGQRPQRVVLRATGPGTRCSSHRPQHLTPHSGLIHGSGQRPQRVMLRRPWHAVFEP
jgi:hypothetical protein